jgi:hypothetical protein
MSRPSLGYSNYYWIRQDQKKAEAKASELELQDDNTSNGPAASAAANPNNPPTLEEKTKDSWKSQHDSLVVNPQNRLESSELAAAQHDSPESLVESPPDTQESYSSLPESLETPVIPVPPEVMPPSFPLVNQITSWKPQTDSEK